MSTRTFKGCTKRFRDRGSVNAGQTFDFMNPSFRPLAGKARISLGLALQNQYLWKWGLSQRRNRQECGRITEPFWKRRGGLEGAFGFSAPRKLRKHFSKLRSIHIQLRTLQEVPIILSMRIRTKLAIEEQPTPR